MASRRSCSPSIYLAIFAFVVILLITSSSKAPGTANSIGLPFSTPTLTEHAALSDEHIQEGHSEKVDSPHKIIGPSAATIDKRIDLFSSSASRKLKKKGQQFQCWLDGAPGVKPAKFTNPSEIEQWGWTLEVEKDKDYGHVAKELNKMDGINVGDMKEGMGMKWTHSLKTEIKDKDGKVVKVYPPTDAVFYNIYWNNILLAQDNKSPEYNIQHGKTRATFTKDTPKIPQTPWSDVVSLNYAKLSSAKMKDLRFVLRRVITNDVTINILKKIMKAKGYKDGKAPEAPGVVINAETDGWYLLLASPNVSGVCWLLLQHQAELGGKTIKSITAFNEFEKGDYTPSMVIELANKGS